MIKIIGKFNTAVCFTDSLEPIAKEQIRSLCNMEALSQSQIRIMPDVHAGKGCTIGTTMTIHDKVVPAMVGVDIGCGMESVRLTKTDEMINLAKLDDVIHRHIPAGFKIREMMHGFAEEINLSELRCTLAVDLDRAYKSIGTLGGGNHFIELARSEHNDIYLVIHSGSRNLGKAVADYYQDAAYNALDPDVRNELTKLGNAKDLAYVEGQLFDDYLHDMKIVQRFALLNRKAMVDTILDQMDLTPADAFTTIHNYIDIDTMILRKGAVSAQAGERLLIPINMRDGSLICIGKGNQDWNTSAPHGAGRLMSRSTAFKELSMDQFKEEMKAVYSTSVSLDTLDEAPMAYKPMAEIIRQITPTADVIEQIKPLYNFKASEKRKRKR